VQTPSKSFANSKVVISTHCTDKNRLARRFKGYTSFLLWMIAQLEKIENKKPWSMGGLLFGAKG
jgi:hypothetical protein